MKTVIEMAREAGFTPTRQEPLFIEMLEHFAEIVRADEREAVLRHTIKAHDVDGNCDIVLCADIRARGETSLRSKT